MKLQAVLPLPSTPYNCNAGDHDNMNMEYDSFDKSVVKRKGRNDCNNRGKDEKKNKRHLCNLCHKTFAYASSLKTHMLTHTGSKPFVCVLCGKAFSLACNLKTHEMVHTGEKPFLCDVCSKGFTRASHLKEHKRIHTGERPYKCPHCEADFNQSNHVQKHIRTVHADNSCYDVPVFEDLGRSKTDPGGKPEVGADSGERPVLSGHPQNQSLIHTGAPAVRSDLTQPRPGEASHQVASYCEDDGEMDEDGDRESYGDLQPGPNHYSQDELPLSTTVTSPQTTVQSSEEYHSEDTGIKRQTAERSREELLYSLIKRKQVNYMTLPVTNDEEIIYCEECDQESHGDCPIHSHFQNQRNPSSSETTSSPPQPSCNDRPSPHKSANTSGSLLSQDRSHVCQRCSAAFVMFNSLKLHMMFIHGEKLQAVLPVSSVPNGSDGGDANPQAAACPSVFLGDKGPPASNHDNMNTEHSDFHHSNRAGVNIEHNNFHHSNHADMNIEHNNFHHSNHADMDIEHNNFHHSNHADMNLECNNFDQSNHADMNIECNNFDHSNHANVKMELDNFDNRESVEKRTGEIDQDGDKCKKKKIYRQTCDVCFKSFTDLKQHKLTHTGYRQFECSMCSKSFSHACNLKTHELTHTGQKPFVCDVCSKAFTRDCHLKAHKRIHTGERPYKCPHCEADFNQSNHVQKHIRTVHSGNRRFVCEICGGTFARSGHLEKHKRVHSSRKRPTQSYYPKKESDFDHLM